MQNKNNKIYNGYFSGRETSPFQLVVGARRECGGFQHFAHLFSTKAKIVYGPHIAKFDNFDLENKKETQC
jgi:hypothetical protein